MMVFFLSNMIENQLMSTGAFEITLNGEFDSQQKFINWTQSFRFKFDFNWLPLPLFFFYCSYNTFDNL